MKNILRSCDPKFKHIVAIIKETKDLQAVTTEQLLGSLQTYKENKKKEKGTMEQLLKMKLYSTIKDCSHNIRSQQGQGCGGDQGKG